MAMMKKKLDANRLNLKDEVVSINRVTKVVKGGKNMSFAALVVIGDPGEGVVGVQNVLTKSLGSANPHNVIKATFDALIQLRNKAEVAALRGKSVEEM
jgi:ribosomal protein S5